MMRIGILNGDTGGVNCPGLIRMSILDYKSVVFLEGWRGPIENLPLKTLDLDLLKVAEVFFG